MRRLRDFYRTNFWSSGRQRLFQLLELDSNAVAGIVLEEIGRPGGQTTLHQWWKTYGLAYYQRMERATCDLTPQSAAPAERPVTDFDKLLALLRSWDTPPLNNFAGMVRDGVAYSLAWGDRRQFRDVSVQNPDDGSRHIQFIQALRENTWSK